MPATTFEPGDLAKQAWHTVRVLDTERKPWGPGYVVQRTAADGDALPFWVAAHQLVTPPAVDRTGA